MQPHFIHIVAFFTLALVASHAAIAPEQYWNSVLPNTPMPKAISDLLQPDYAEEKSTSVNVGKGGVDVNAGKGKPAGGTGVNVGRKGVGVDAGKPGKGTNVGVGKGGVSVNTGNKGKPAISTEVEGKTQFQKYEITAGVRRMKGEKSVVCHKQNYAYAVFYCHSTQTTNAYIVPLEGADGTKAKVVAVCHRDTSAWNPKHLAFQVLKVMPGTVPICHFLPQDHIVWVPK
ncbi:putative BURP domain-containing protein [Tripterygium wilfordii]|uniref:Putative BURP domain-containing protein n=1 Tax=Tripterygium wilfordii TaxID=458696 RepID=A0A7J7BWZ6_TRIWF|nr:putative BURP domain-containing protein [Tripterygium wilfordii]